MSPELIAKIKKWATSGFAILLVVVGVFKPEWAADAQRIFADLGVGLDSLLAAISAIVMLLSSGNLSTKNLV